MARIAREKSESGIYHVFVRGINRQNIFQEGEDEREFLDRLTHYKKACSIDLYAYAMMSNHVHLLLKREDGIGSLMQKLEVSYSHWFNQKYDRVGYLFQDRYKSEVVNDDAYFLTVFRYIHQNPQKAGLKSFTKTSYENYVTQTGLVDVSFPLSLFVSQSELLKFLREESNEACIDIVTSRRLTDEHAAEKICKVANVKHPQALQNLSKDYQIRVIQELKKAGLSIRQIERLVGINRGIILRM